jgi:hypothetical protein
MTVRDYLESGSCGIFKEPSSRKEGPMREKEISDKLNLIEREFGVLVEDLDKVRLEWRGQMDEIRIEIESLKAFLQKGDPEFSAHFKKIKTQTLREKNPEWISGQL